MGLGQKQKKTGRLATAQSEDEPTPGGLGGWWAQEWGAVKPSENRDIYRDISFECLLTQKDRKIEKEERTGTKTARKERRERTARSQVLGPRRTSETYCFLQ